MQSRERSNLRSSNIFFRSDLLKMRDVCASLYTIASYIKHVFRRPTFSRRARRVIRLTLYYNNNDNGTKRRPVYIHIHTPASDA